MPLISTIFDKFVLNYKSKKKKKKDKPEFMQKNKNISYIGPIFVQILINYLILNLGIKLIRHFLIIKGAVFNIDSYSGKNKTDFTEP